MSKKRQNSKTPKQLAPSRRQSRNLKKPSLFIRLKAKLTLRNAWLTLGIILICAGMAFGGFSAISTWWTMRHQHPQTLKSTPIVPTPDPLITGTPVHIAIPNVNIDLSVIPGYYYPSTNSWTLTLNDAQWGAMTAKPNNKEGDTYIYAHYRVRVFYNLPKVQPGDQAIVTTDNGHTFTYTYVNNIVTTPTDLSLFQYKGKPILILQTCSGLWYQYRQLFTFNLTKVT